MESINLIYEHDIELVREYCESGSNLAANTLIRKYQSFVYSVSFRYVNNSFDAQDLSQEVFIKVLKNLDKFQGNSTLKTWIYRITVNHCKDYLRKQKFKNFFFNRNNENRQKDKVNELSYEILNQIELNDFNFHLIKFINSLPARQKEVFSLRYFDDLQYEEISQMLNLSIGSLKATYHIAVKKISEEFKNDK